MTDLKAWDKVYFIEDESELPKSINQTTDYPFTFEIQTLKTIFNEEILKIVECRYESSTFNDYRSRVEAFVIIKNPTLKP